MFPVRGGRPSIYADGYGFWVGNFPFWKEPVYFNFNLFFPLWKPEKSGVAPAFLRAWCLHSAYDWNWKSSWFYIKGYNKHQSLTRFYPVLQKWDFKYLLCKGKTRSMKSHLRNGEILTAQPAASCPKRAGLGWWDEKCCSHCSYCLRERRHKKAVQDLWRRGYGVLKERDQRRRQKGGSCLVVWRLLIQGCSPCRS